MRPWREDAEYARESRELLHVALMVLALLVGAVLALAFCSRPARGAWLRCEVPVQLAGHDDPRWIELRRSSVAGDLDTGFSARVDLATCDAARSVRERPLPRWLRACWWQVMPTDKDWLYQCRPCNFAGCAEWRAEAHVECSHIGGSGCPCRVYPAAAGCEEGP